MPNLTNPCAELNYGLDFARIEEMVMRHRDTDHLFLSAPRQSGRSLYSEAVRMAALYGAGPRTIDRLYREHYAPRVDTLDNPQPEPEMDTPKQYRVLVCGGRDFFNRRFLYNVLNDYLDHTPTVIIEGGARGADRLARDWANEKGIPVETFEADWEQHGRSAGPIRNSRMLKEGKPDLVVAFGGGKGTQNMKTLARNAGVALSVW